MTKLELLHCPHKIYQRCIGDEAHRVSGNDVDVEDDVNFEDDVGVKNDVDVNDDDVEHGNGSAVIKLR